MFIALHVINPLKEGPVDLLKAKMQVQYGGANVVRYNSMLDCATHLVRNYGIKGSFHSLFVTALLVA